MNLKELKQLKTIKAIRHDKNFVSTDDYLKQIETNILKENYQIIDKQKQGMRVEYILFNPDKMTEHKVYLQDDFLNDTQYINEILQHYKNDGLTVLKHYINNNFLYVTTKENKIGYTVHLKADYLKEYMHGFIQIRSKDYIFKFIDDNGMERCMYGENLKADMLQDDKIILKNGIEYILQV